MIDAPNFVKPDCQILEICCALNNEAEPEAFGLTAVSQRISHQISHPPATSPFLQVDGIDHQEALWAKIFFFSAFGLSTCA